MTESFSRNSAINSDSEVGKTSETRDEPKGTDSKSGPDRGQAQSDGRIDPGGSRFNPDRWKTATDARLDPNAKIRPNVQVKIEIAKPPKDHFVHVHPDPEFNGVFPLYVDSQSKRPRHYLIAPELEPSLPALVRVNIVPTRLALTIIDTNRLFLWKVAQTGSEWHESGDNAILTGMVRWVKVIPETSGYRIEYPMADLSAPVFPDWRPEFVLEKAFGIDGYIADSTHEVIRRLAGMR